MKKDTKQLKLIYRSLQLIVLTGWMIEMVITAKVGRAAFCWLPFAMLPITALAALAAKVFYRLPKEEKKNVRIFSPSLLDSHPALLLFMMIATLDKGKQYKQQQNGLSTLPKVPPGKEKGGIFA